MTIIRNFLIFIVVLFLMGAAALVGYNLAFQNLIFPRVAVAGIEVSGMDKKSAVRLLELYFSKEPNSLVLRYGEVENRRFEKFEVSYDFLWAVDQALGVGRTGNLLTRLNEQINGVASTRLINLPIKYDQDEMEGILDQTEAEMNSNPVWPYLSKKDGDVVLNTGRNGVAVDRERLKIEILRYLALPGKHVLDVPMQIVLAEEDKIVAEKARAVASKWLGKKLVLKGREVELVLSDDEVLPLFGLSGDAVNVTGFDQLVEKIRPRLETDPKDAIFIFEDNKVKEFRPETVGTRIDIPKFNEVLGKALYDPENTTVEISLILSFPKITTGDINNLGIKELIGSGKSQFAHSIPGRVFNVNLAASRINGVLVAPGEEFSFNESVGEISRETGYQSAYIISGGKTVLGDGGGVCQVSTTVFRAVLNAGLPVTERKAHAYRVGYYEQDSKPGVDATVYNPTADLKFRNDTGKHVLIQTAVDTKNMKMKVDIFGTNDGRKSVISEPRISGQQSPPATMYVDDPTLSKGITKQVDWSAWGAKVSFDYRVEKDGETVFEKTFYSNYQPWQAVYLVGTRE